MSVIVTRSGKNAPLTNAELDANFDNLNTGKLELSGGTLTGALTLHADPTQALHAASKQYVDEVAEGLRAKPAARAATTTNLAAVYDNGTAGVGATLTADTDRVFTTLDGVTGWAITTPPMGVLVKNQTNSAHNGRYNLTALGEVGVSPWVLTRCSLCDEADEIPGAYTFVQFGTANGGTGWVQTVVDPDTFVVGTDAIIVAQFSGAGTYTAGTGLTLTGTQFAMAADQLLPSQTGNNGKFLTTDGTAASWATMTAPNNGTLTLTVAGTGLSGGTTFTADQASNATFTVTSNATSDNTVGAVVARDGSGNFTAGTITAALSGNATTATTLATGRTIAITGDLTYTSGSFNGSANVTGTGTLANSGVAAGSYTYSSITVDAKGRVTAASSGAEPSAFPAGTKMLFQQTAAPTGWTKDTTHDNKALRVVSGTAGSGGSVAFTTAFGTPSVTGSVSLSGSPGVGNLGVSVSGNVSVSAHTLSVNEMPSHRHSITARNSNGNDFVETASANVGNAHTNNNAVGLTGGSGSHNHGANFSGSGSVNGAPAIGNLAGSLSSATAAINVQYVDLIIATKD